MNKTYHDYLEALYAGRVSVFAEQGGLFRAAPYRDNPEPFDNFARIPSFHFGDLFDEGVLDQWHNPADAPWAAAEDLMHEQKRDRAAFVVDFDYGRGTVIVSLDVVSQPGHVVMTGAIIQSRVRVPTVPAGEWVTFEGDATGMFGPQFITIAYAALKILGNQNVRYVVREPSSGMKRLANARKRKGEESPADMQTIRLTKTIYIEGRAIRPTKGTHASPKPHDRAGHWRHSLREVRGWEEVQPTTGEYAGVIVWRKWINTAAIRGGQPKESAPQYRVVR